MKIPLFLALTAAEFSFCRPLPEKTAWLACHFSPSGPGLSNIPSTLPEGSLLILDDSIPFHHHHPGYILQQLKDAISKLQPQGLILDFQRPLQTEVQEIALLLQQELSCPVAAPPDYSDGHSPLFLPPIPLHITPGEYLSPYVDREIWLEAASGSTKLHITRDGCRMQTEFCTDCGDFPHHDPQLFCHYQTLCRENEILFYLHRTEQDQRQLWEVLPRWGVSRLIGLWQELKE